MMDREKVHEGIKEVVKPFDWSYTTDYTGTVRSGGSNSSTNGSSNSSSSGSSSARQFEPCDGAIPMALLQRPDPILFYDSLILYEDELADNGVSMLSCKIRVMPARMLLLLRFFLRLDDVVVRIRDTRLYIDFDSLEVMREYVAREEDFASVKAVRSILSLFLFYIFLFVIFCPLLLSSHFLYNETEFPFLLSSLSFFSSFVYLFSP